MERIAYGSDPLQFGDLRVPQEEGLHPVVIVIHGGFWRANYDLEYIGHLCAELTGAGLATWSLEYRRIGNPGGGWPGTLQDVARGADHLRLIAVSRQLDLARVLTLGHSAGGHLALWLGSRRKIPRDNPLHTHDPVNLAGIVSLAGVSDLKRAWALRLNDTVVANFLGGSPDEVPDRYRVASPIEQLPLGIPQKLLHGTADINVPFEISEGYVSAATARGDAADLITLQGAGHFELVDPRSKEFGRVREAVMSLLDW